MLWWVLLQQHFSNPTRHDILLIPAPRWHVTHISRFHCTTKQKKKTPIERWETSSNFFLRGMTLMAVNCQRRCTFQEGGEGRREKKKKKESLQGQEQHNNAFPTNNSLLISFRPSSDAEILLMSTDRACKSGPRVWMQRVVCSNWAFILQTTVSGWVCSPSFIVVFVLLTNNRKWSEGLAWLRRMRNPGRIEKEEWKKK